MFECFNEHKDKTENGFSFDAQINLRTNDYVIQCVQYGIELNTL